ncbi:leucine-rich repeat receptor-like serine/threonine-protein kinase [Senna tora]|uniref:Leucine-rich repeat receptor-like serine/threonine-protein kinase n=1 Tax=Senna tora TaxID=362788 RepID=A0A834T358_9FABA|nr:leucine-rich repeat receptor-like serine/threonine-protein kinase [Senna tora]
MLRYDPRSSHAMTTPIGPSNPLRLVSTTRIEDMLRHDPRSSHAKTTPIAAWKPLSFANTTRTDVFDSLAQQVFCLVIREVPQLSASCQIDGNLPCECIIREIEALQPKQTTQLCWDFSMEVVAVEAEISQEGEVANMRRYGPTQTISLQVQHCDSLMLMAACDSMPFTEVI